MVQRRRTTIAATTGYLAGPMLGRFGAPFFMASCHLPVALPIMGWHCPFVMKSIVWELRHKYAGLYYAPGSPGVTLL
ncbi:hypothetical protein PHO31112_03903 [Pandoraea horticolens]|uniref:Uncharacterized protein n=1 Tax=Pandoraea horticolens TaxID=2508298 RepID=A0A5E4XJ32_9BURK|nr:hypothetical protein PHO31112_03903 [Pandoraea horticolens]